MLFKLIVTETKKNKITEKINELTVATCVYMKNEK